MGNRQNVALNSIKGHKARKGSYSFRAHVVLPLSMFYYFFTFFADYT